MASNLLFEVYGKSKLFCQGTSYSVGEFINSSKILYIPEHTYRTGKEQIETSEFSDPKLGMPDRCQGKRILQFYVVPPCH